MLAVRSTPLSWHVVFWCCAGVSAVAEETGGGMAADVYDMSARGAWAGAIGLLVVAGYYLAVWLWAGNKQFRREVALRPTPPDSLSPAALRYIDRMGYDESQLAAAILSMAVKGYLHIEDKDRTVAVVRDEAPERVLAPEERELAHRIFDGRTKLVLSWSNRQVLTGLHRHFRYVLEARYRKKLFNAHTAFRITGVVLSTMVLAVMFVIHFTNDPSSDALRRLLDFALGALCATAGGLLSVHEYRRAKAGRSSKVPLATGLIAVVMALLGAGLMFDAAGSLYTERFGGGLGVLCALVAINWLFLVRLPNYSRDGWRLMVEAEGFRRFVQSGYRPEHEDVPTSRLFETGLPCAVALGVGEGWAALFESMLTREPRSARAGFDYTPVWYSGLKWERQTPADFVASLQRTLTAAVTSMSAPAGHEPAPPRGTDRRPKPPKQSATGTRNDE